MPDPFKQQKFKGVIAQLAGEFIQSESNHQSLITVTDILVTDDFQKATIFVTVLPEQKQDAALDFLKRQRKDFKKFIKKKSRMSRIPQFDFMLDAGEKHRQKIDELI